MFAPPARAKRLPWKIALRPFSINVHFARAGEAFIVFDARHARVSRFSKPAPPARAKRLQWKLAFTSIYNHNFLSFLSYTLLHSTTLAIELN
jgi:hypothetical protein